MPLYERLLKSPSFARIITTLGDAHAQNFVDKVQPYLNSGEKLVDIGPGLCIVSSKLKNKGFEVTPIDIINASPYPDIKPIRFDGGTLPFKNNAFDVALLLAVLHHIPDPENTLKEAARVAKRLVVIEDVFENFWQQHATYIMDTIVNFEYFHAAHTNKTSNEWLHTFAEMNLEVLDHKEVPFWGIFQHAIFHLAKRSNQASARGH